MHPQTINAIHLLLNQLYQSAQNQIQLAQSLKQLVSQGSQPAPQRPQVQMPQMQPDYMNQQEEALLAANIQQSQIQAAAADGNPLDQYIGAVEGAMGGLSPHLGRARQRAQQQRPQQQQMPQNGGPMQAFDPFGGMMDAMGGFGGG